MEDPHWLTQYLEVTEWLPTDDFNSGRVPPIEGKDPYVLAFGALIKKVSTLHAHMLKELARKERLSNACQRKDLTPTHQKGGLLGSHYERTLKKKAAENPPVYDGFTDEDYRDMEEMAEQNRIHQALIDQQEGEA